MKESNLNILKKKDEGGKAKNSQEKIGAHIFAILLEIIS